MFFWTECHLPLGHSFPTVANTPCGPAVMAANSQECQMVVHSFEPQTVTCVGHHETTILSCFDLFNIWNITYVLKFTLYERYVDLRV